MIVIGVDPGTKRTGYGIIQKRDNRFLYIGSGIFNLTTAKTIQDKLQSLYKDFTILLKKYKPVSVAIEDIFYSKNVKSTIKLGYIKGTIFLATIHCGIKVVEYAPTKVKSSVTGNGRASKEAVRKMINCLVENIADLQFSDESDALAIAYCHLIEENFKSFLNFCEE